MQKTLTIGFLFILFNLGIQTNVFSQQNNIIFKEAKSDNNITFAIFKIEGIKDINHKAEVEKFLSETKNIIFARISEEGKCELKFNNKIDTDKIISLLKKFDLKINENSYYYSNSK